MDKVDYEQWASFEEISLMQAAYLWCDKNPPDKPLAYDMDNPETLWPHPPIVNSWIVKLKEAIETGELMVSREVPPRFWTDSNGKTHKTLLTKYISIKELQRYALSIKQKPKFLFPPDSDAINPDVLPQKESRELGKESRELGKESRELGQLRAEKSKWDESIKAAVHIGQWLATLDNSIIRQNFLDEIQNQRFKLSATTEDKIWKAIPDKYKHGSGRPPKK
ncbi:hypothetical protein KA005_08065 [bacterium]|nr:hypothetical protein [bacterium]